MLVSLVYLSLSLVSLWFLLVSGLSSFLFLHTSFWQVGWFDFSHPSLLFVFHLSVNVFLLGLLIFMFIMMVLWSVGVPSLVLILKASSSSITIAVMLFVVHFVVSI